MSDTSPKIWLLGTSFETTNMGLNALTESTLKCIYTRWHDAEVVLPSPKANAPDQSLNLLGRTVQLHKRELWFGRNIFKPNNVYFFILCALLMKVLPLRNYFMQRYPTFRSILETDFVMDITGGDSFTDMYRMPRFRQSSWLKWLFILCNKKLILLPQTYGPFQRRSSQWIARYLISHAHRVFSRDQNGITTVTELLNQPKFAQIPIQFIPDVAFVLDPVAPEHPVLTELQALKQQQKILIGLNISGLLYNGGAQADAKYQLQSSYRELVEHLIALLLRQENTVVMLLSHVHSQPPHVESDPHACQQVYEKLSPIYAKRLIWMRETFDHREMKYVIGQCDFFLGSRMHACIGAISQAIPTVGLAYSGKFIGVFAAAGVGETVVDLRKYDTLEVLAHVETTFLKRREIAEQLRATVPQIKQRVLQLFDYT